MKPSFSLKRTPIFTVFSTVPFFAVYVISPESALRLSVRIFISVYLPEPLGPSRAYMPGSKDAVNEFSARLLPYDFEILLTVSFIIELSTVYDMKSFLAFISIETDVSNASRVYMINRPYPFKKLFEADNNTSGVAAMNEV